MPIQIKTAIRKGWKANENERFGEILEFRFIDTKTNKIIFRYAPKLEDRAIWESGFNMLLEWDIKHKELIALANRFEDKSAFSCGECQKVLDEKEGS